MAILFSIINISLSLKTSGSMEEEALEFEFFKPIRFNTNNNKYFKFKYEKKEPLVLIIIFKRTGEKVKVTDSNGNTPEVIKIEDDKATFNIISQGLYFLEFYKSDSENPFAVDNEFVAILPGNIIDTIDFSQKMYYSNLEFDIRKKEYNPCKYIVKNLKKDTFVYFVYGKYKYDNYREEYENPFEICLNKVCKKDIILFNFLKGKEYTINIHFSRQSIYNRYHYFPYVFFPINENTIQTIEKGIYKSSEPRIYNIDLNNEQQNLDLLQLNSKYFLMSSSVTKITKNNLDNLQNLNLTMKGEELILEKNLKYYILITIPPVTTNEFMDDSSRVVIVDQVINNALNKSITIPAGTHSLIYLDSDYDDDYSNLQSSKETKHLRNYNVLRAYSSSEKNLQYVMSNKTEEFDFLIENGYKHPIYINKREKEVNITIDSYYPRYNFFGVMDQELFKSYLSFFLRYSYGKDDESTKSKVFIEPELYLPINIRVNSDLNEFYDYFNLYLNNFEENVNVYINKIYGETEFYECSNEIDMKNLSILTTPLTNCKDKKSIFNRLFSLKGTKLISGYLSPHSYFDVYIEYNDDENNIIKIPSVSDNTVNSASKYIRKNIIYKVDFDVDHMVKIEPGINAEVTIFNEEKTIKLNSNNPTFKLQGKNYFVKTNNDTMIYFYGKLNSYLKQIKIDPNQKGKNIRIVPSQDYEFWYCIDTGFEGYNPLNSAMKDKISLDDDEGIYIENIYEKIKNKLVKNENLYFYIACKNVNQVRIKLEYNNETLISPNNDYSFAVIPRNSINKGIVVNNRKNKNEKQRIYMGAYFCQKNSEVKLFLKYGNDEVNDEVSYSFSTEKGNSYKKKNIKEYGIILRFESYEDFIFTYSFDDSTDNNYIYEWEEERIVLNDLNITNITENSQDEKTILSIEFNPNYIKSTTKYIIIVSLEEDNSFDNFQNPCYIAKLATDKPPRVKIENFFYAGEENNTINVQVDINDILDAYNNKYIVNIISQELRFDKQLNFYIPKEFIHIIKAIDIQIGSKTGFDLNNNRTYFNLPLNENPSNNEMLLLHYVLRSNSPIIIKITNPDNKEQSFNINNKEGYINFLYDKKGTFSINFNNIKNQILINNNNEIRGEFSILSSESSINLNANNDNVEFNEFIINRKDLPTLKLNIYPLDKDYTKKFVISNYNLNNINEIVSIKKNNEEYKDLNFSYYTFEKYSKYEITIKFHKKDTDNYILEKFNILDYSNMNIEDIFSNTKKYNDINDKFYIINWKKIETVSITTKNKNPVFLLAHISESQSTNLFKNIQNYQFDEIDNLTISKPEEYYYSILMIELSEYNTEVNIELKMIKNDEDDDDDDDNKTLYIILFSSLGGIILVIALIFIIKCIIKKQKGNSFEKETKEIAQDKLLQDM